MPSGPHRPRFYLGVLIAGFITGGFLTAWTPTFGPVSANLLVLDFTLGPIGLHVSLLSLVGVVVAYLIARSLF